MTFQDAVSFVLSSEGGLSDNSWDDGGLTKYGISSKSHPGVDVKNLTKDEAIAIYKAQYWDAVRGEDLPPMLRLPVFDAAVQHSPRRAIKMLQESLRVTADGVIGPHTLAALGGAEWNDLTADFLSRRMLLYAAHPDWPVAGRGWSKRMFLVQQASLL